MSKHHEWRLRVSLRPDLPETATVKYLKGEGNDLLPESYRILTAVQVFYGTEAAAAAGSAETRTIALEAIGQLLEQCVLVAQQGGIDLETLAVEPSVLTRLLQSALERREPFKRRRQVKVTVTAEINNALGRNGNASQSAIIPKPVPLEAEPPPRSEESVTAAPTEEKPKRRRLF